MTDLVVDVPPIRNGLRDALAQQGLEAASEGGHGGFGQVSPLSFPVINLSTRHYCS
jgi:hypothetical protein